MDLSFSGLFSALLISTVGMGLLMYGKKAEKPLYLVVGLGMCVYPYFITSAVALWLVTAGILVPLFALRRSA